MIESNEYQEVYFGPFTLGGDPYGLRRGADPIKLRPMSLQFLRYCAERPGQFVSKEELLTRVWSGRVISDSGLRMCAQEIRAVLDDDAKNPQYLETVVGKGYRFLEGARGKAVSADRAGPIVGRDAELRHLDDCFRSAIDGHTQFVLLAGEPGIGKTTLLESFIDRISLDRDANLIQGQCVIHYGKQEAYGPMLEAIGTFYRDHGDAGFLKEMERHAPTWLLQIPEMIDAMLFERLKHRTEGMAPERMAREFCQLIAALAGKKTVIIAMEDLHWADVATVDLLAALAEHRELSLLILGTYRPADAVLYSQSLRDTVRELKGRGLCRELLLELLTETDLAEYLAGRLNGKISPELTERLYPRTGGNPLFMVGLVEELIRTQALVCHDGTWRAADPTGALATEIPESLHSLISRSLDALPPMHREMLEVASVVGMDFSSAAMTDALVMSIEAIESEFENLIVDGQFIEPRDLVTWADGTLTGSFRFKHHLYLEVVYRHIAEARRARIHLKVGDRLEAGYGEQAPEIAATLAVHFDFGQDHERALRYHRLSADQALERHAYTTAIDELRSVLEKLDLMPETTERNQQQLDCLILLGSALIAMQGYSSPEVEKTFSRALQICDTLADSEAKFNAVWNLIGYSMARGDLEQSRRMVETVAGLAQQLDNPDLDLLVEDAFTQQYFFEGDFKNASERAARVLAHYDLNRHGKLALAYSQEDPAQMCAGIDAIATSAMGSSTRSLAREALVHELSEELNIPNSTGFGLLFCAIASQFRRDPLATGKYSDQLIELADRYELHWRPIALVLKGWATAKQTPGGENLEMIETGLAQWREAGVRLFTPFCLGLLAEAQGELGQIEEARVSVADALSLVAQTREGWFESELHRLHGELLLQSKGDPQDAEQSFMRSLEMAGKHQALVFELYAAVSLSRLWVEQGKSMEVPALLQPIIARFDENSDDSDLNQARKLVAVNR